MSPLKFFPSAEPRPLPAGKLGEVYRRLRRHFGHQHWWPGETPFEIMTGAILTQNTAWSNVEKAIVNLKRARVLTPAAMRRVPVSRLAALIRPAGYFNVKAARLKHFTDFLFRSYGGRLEKMFREKGEALREKLLGVNGIGPETADSILLYAAGKPFFVIDAYTRRIFIRHRIHASGHPKGRQAHLRRLEEMEYSDWQELFRRHLPRRPGLYNDFHAQIVALAKSFCRARECACGGCPLSQYL